MVVVKTDGLLYERNVAEIGLQSEEINIMEIIWVLLNACEKKIKLLLKTHFKSSFL